MFLQQYTEDKDGGDTYYYQSKEEGISNVESIITLFNSFPKQTKIYRTIAVREGQKINYENLGFNWTFDKRSALEFSKFFSGNIVLTGEIDEKDVDWMASFKVYFEFSNGAYKRMSETDYNEKELYIPDPKKVKNVDYFEIDG